MDRSLQPLSSDGLITPLVEGLAAVTLQEQSDNDHKPFQYLQLPYELRQLIARLALPSRVLIWHDNESCNGLCGRRARCLIDPAKYSIQCLRHGSCDCYGDKSYFKLDYDKHPHKFNKPSCRYKSWRQNFIMCPKLKQTIIPGLWLACRQLYEETIKLMYGFTTFAFDSKQTLGLWMAQRIRHKLLVHDVEEGLSRLRSQNLFIRNVEMPFAGNIYKGFRTAPHLRYLLVHEDTAALYKRQSSELGNLPSVLITKAGHNVCVVYINPVSTSPWKYADGRAGTTAEYDEQLSIHQDKMHEKRGCCPHLFPVRRA